ncbi:MAG TPA: rhodanese-like domain-containing protein [Dehalococcoidia bacterium]|jgi:thiosulfate/3-mercaptopyruvate sulfurtransferase|nr:sulfurtransferase [Chloroflexota bacterium]MDP6056403.1 rhodanese-like domain-containing protein [Dehalococcoidia bacterium]MDP7090678.1 rhodanese-like domain-containing protein [Dehalococcoidia bacterium]MDP7261924.1 rhodanese-like domain-containing protein [Dehalococcoidia bacterium]MDP7485251.1 rhodanese-like domain-containing protein [Dehalococcoidia bacterium]|tara:strand:- start:2367 stop:3098 length:732 start_codon:yes stop_codon:yes gene_type:complete
MSIPSIIPPSERGYSISDVFVTTDWLSDHISDPNVRLVDTDIPDEYTAGHIPGAVNPVDHYYKTSLDDRTHIQGPEQFAQTMANLGIDNDTLVIGYNRSGGVYSFRLMWALHYYGHTNVRVLDGGLEKWVAEGRETTTEVTSYAGRTGTFSATENSEIFASRDRVISAIDDDSTILMDVRSDDEWSGENKRGGPRGGRIPGAVHLEWTHFMTEGEIPSLKTAPEIRKILTDVGITPDKNVITY